MQISTKFQAPIAFDSRVSLQPKVEETQFLFDQKMNWAAKSTVPFTLFSWPSLIRSKKYFKKYHPKKYFDFSRDKFFRVRKNVQQCIFNDRMKI